MRKKVKSLILVITALCCIAFAGCGKQTAATLEDLAASNADITKTIKEDITVPGGMTAVVEFSGDSFDIVYTYDDAVDDEDKKVLTSAFDANSDELKANCEEVISSLEQQTGITGITGNIIFKNSDGQELWTCTSPDQQ